MTQMSPVVFVGVIFRLLVSGNAEEMGVEQGDDIEFLCHKMEPLREAMKAAKNIVVITGDRLSQEAGVPNFHTIGSNWRRFHEEYLIKKKEFPRYPSIIWEFYAPLRQITFDFGPNKAHFALAAYEKHVLKEGRNFTLLTHNIDGLHDLAGSKNVVELHGSLYKTECTGCRKIVTNRDNPICEVLSGKRMPESNETYELIDNTFLPHCKNESCNTLVLPYIFWFQMDVPENVREQINEAIAKCDLCIKIGPSETEYSAELYENILASRGVPVAEFSTEPMSYFKYKYYFKGKLTDTIPEAFRTD